VWHVIAREAIGIGMRGWRRDTPIITSIITCLWSMSCVSELDCVDRNRPELINSTTSVEPCPRRLIHVGDEEEGCRHTVVITLLSLRASSSPSSPSMSLSPSGPIPFPSLPGWMGMVLVEGERPIPETITMRFFCQSSLSLRIPVSLRCLSLSRREETANCNCHLRR
jgi:hypothetical protein